MNSRPAPDLSRAGLYLCSVEFENSLMDRFATAPVPMNDLQDWELALVFNDSSFKVAESVIWPRALPARLERPFPRR